VRIGNRQGRAVILVENGTVDVATTSKHRFSSSIDEAISHLDEVRSWWQSAAAGASVDVFDESMFHELGPVVDNPSQVFAIGLNYHAHASEMGLHQSEVPMVFGKFASCLAGPFAQVPRVSEMTDWEAELVFVIGRRGRDISVDDALDYVAGYCVGQDMSDRELQMKGSPAQFSMGKSFRNFGPIGPWLTSADEVADPNDLDMICKVNGQVFQDSSTSNMIFSVRDIIAYVSTVCELRPGDVFFTGSPDGTGKGQSPPRFLQLGDVVSTTIERLGTISNEVVAPK
jgi:2-keto-4-pentenoate hydratase/2-oxohepta-3-ene-1,7-dioic acid hydratase in catechol pathway